MLRNARAFQELGAAALRDQRTRGKEPALGVPPASRQQAAPRSMACDYCKRAPVLFGDGIGIELAPRQDVVGDQWIFPGTPGPGSRGHTKQANPGARRGCEVVCRTPDG